MQEVADMELLRQYVQRNSDEAFATLVTRHVNLVYSAALRKTGDPNAAEEITQAVFIILAKKAGRLSPGTILSGWLYQAARLTSASFLRTEIRRARREQEAYMQSLANETEPELWPQMAPLLEDAMGRLGEKDRNAIALRFFEGKSFQEIGTAFGASENAAKKRVAHALEKLHRYFSKRGVSSTTAIIAGAISANSVQAAPPVLAKSVTVAAIAKGAAASSSTLTLIKGALKLMAWTKAKTAIVSSVVVLLAGGVTTIALQELGKGNSPAYILEGHFEDVLEGKHINAGFFTVRVCGSNMLVDMTFENGFREITGTDGRDTFTYIPITGDKTASTNWNGIAYISNGRFPTNAHFFEQVLWLACVHDWELLTNLPALIFPFNEHDTPEDIAPQMKTCSNLPNLLIRA